MCVFFKNFIEVCHNEWMRGHTIFSYKFCSFWSCGLRETSRVVDYTTERRKTEREKMFYITLHRPTTERRSFVWERKILKFYFWDNEWMNERISLCSFVELWTERNLYDGRLHRFWRFEDFEREKFLYVSHHRATTERRNFFFREILIIFRGVFKFLLKYAEIFENS